MHTGSAIGGRRAIPAIAMVCINAE